MILGHRSVTILFWVTEVLHFCFGLHMYYNSILDCRYVWLLLAVTRMFQWVSEVLQFYFELHK